LTRLEDTERDTARTPDHDESLWENASDALREFADKAKERLNEAADAAKEHIGGFANKTREHLSDATDKAKLFGTGAALIGIQELASFGALPAQPPMRHLEQAETPPAQVEQLTKIPAHLETPKEQQEHAAQRKEANETRELLEEGPDAFRELLEQREKVEKATEFINPAEIAQIDKKQR
jgi:hypothetical protein